MYDDELDVELSLSTRSRQLSPINDSVCRSWRHKQKHDWLGCTLFNWVSWVQLSCVAVNTPLVSDCVTYLNFLIIVVCRHWIKWRMLLFTCRNVGGGTFGIILCYVWQIGVADDMLSLCCLANWYVLFATDLKLGLWSVLGRDFKILPDYFVSLTSLVSIHLIH